MATIKHILAGLSLVLLSCSICHAAPGYWVYLKTPVDRDGLERAKQTLERHGLRVRVVSFWLRAISVEASAAQIEQLASQIALARVTPLGVGTRLRAIPSPWLAADAGNAKRQLEQLAVSTLHDCGLTGGGVTIAVLDTGFTLGHKALSAVDVKAAYDFVNNDTTVANESGDPSGQHNHGSLVLALLAGRDAGKFLGVAPDARYLLAKVDDLTSDKPIEDDWWVAGLEWAAKNGADIVSSSISFCTPPCDPKTMNGQTEATSKAAALAAGKGIVLLNSAGNTGGKAGSIRAPGDAKDVLAIGGVDSAGKIAGNSSRGPTADGRTKPDLVGPGVGIFSINPSSTTGYKRYDGTSVATPLVAGVAALLKQAFPQKTPLELMALLKSTASRASNPDNSYGHGLPAVDVATKAHCQKSRDVGVAGDSGSSADASVANDLGAAVDAAGDASVGGSEGGCQLASGQSGHAGATLGWVLLLLGMVARFRSKRIQF
jgi:serine protease AprX